MPPRRRHTRAESEGEDFLWRLATAVAERRKALALSQEKLAEHSGLSPQYLGRIERGQVNVSLDTLERVLFALGPRRKQRVSNAWIRRSIARIDALQQDLSDVKTWLQSRADANRDSPAVATRARMGVMP